MEENKPAKKPSLIGQGGKRGGQWLLTHPMGALQLLLAIVVAIIVLQNLEPTSIDILFWTLVDIPKLVLLIASLLIGALLWEAVRRWRGR